MHVKWAGDAHSCLHLVGVGVRRALLRVIDTGRRERGSRRVGFGEIGGFNDARRLLSHVATFYRTPYTRNRRYKYRVSSVLSRRRIPALQANMAEKPEFDQVEKGHRESIRPDQAKHGDRALAYIGDERVTLTEQDVRHLPRIKP